MQEDKKAWHRYLFWILEASVPEKLVANLFDSVASSRDGHPVLLEYLHHLGNVGGIRRDSLAYGGEHLRGKAALAGEFEHLAAASAVAKAVHRASGHMHERTGHAHDSLACAGELDLALEDKEGLVPVVGMQRRPRSFVALLQGDLIGLCRCV